MHEPSPLTKGPCCVLAASKGRGAVISFDLPDMKTVVVLQSMEPVVYLGWNEIFYWDVCISMQFASFIVDGPGASSLDFTVNLSWGQYKSWKWIWLFIYMHTNRHTLLGVSDDCWYGDSLSGCLCWSLVCKAAHIRQLHRGRWKYILLHVPLGWSYLDWCLDYFFISHLLTCKLLDMLMIYYWLLILSLSTETKIWRTSVDFFLGLVFLSQKIQNEFNQMWSAHILYLVVTKLSWSYMCFEWRR